MLTLATPHGPAHVHEHRGGGAGLLVLGHGAGGGFAAPDLVVATEAATAAGWDVALVEQPYRVAGKKATPRPPVLDEGWLAVVRQLEPRPRLVLGGRSSGARVACRTASELRADGVLALAFPLQPARRRKDGSLPPSRQAELELPRVPVLVVQGATDQFGVPQPDPGRRGVVVLPGDHRLASDRPGLRLAVTLFLQRLS